MKPLLRYGDSGSYVTECQQLLTHQGYNIAVDGMFGSGTEKAVRSFQESKGLWSDGIVGQQTWSALEDDRPSMGFDVCVDEYVPLNPGQYMSEVVGKIGVCIHHTVSDGDPNRIVNLWNTDSRGRVGTHFVIGRKMDNGNTDNDGKIIQCMDLETQWAYHVATTRMGFSSSHNDNANKYYVGIEMCSWGCLDKRNGKYYILGSDIEIDEEEVEVLDDPWRTYKYWHKYSLNQIHALKKLLQALHGQAGLNLEDRPYDPPVNWQWFNLDWEAMALRRKITIHSSFEYGKFDAYPSTEMAAMLRSLYG